MKTLMIEKVKATDLVETYGTPLYVFSEKIIRSKCEEIHRDFLKKYPNTKAVYASKAFLPSFMCYILNEEGIGLDVVSGGEIYTAFKNKFPMSKVEFNGNNKTYEELELAVRTGVGRIIVDNLLELETLEQICKIHQTNANILFRIVPDVISDTHDYISTGHKSSKFGVSLEDNFFFKVLEKALSSPNINFKGIHFHIGSQLLVYDSHINATRKALKLIEDIHSTFDIEVEELNIGGGFGIQYLPSDPTHPITYFLEPCMTLIDNYFAKLKLNRPRIIIEPGRWIIGEAGMTLYTIGSIKENGHITYAAIDGGMTDNIRPSLYQAKYHAVIANKLNEPLEMNVTISGKFCESSDLLIKDIKLPVIETGDILAVMSTGAYNYSMANNYNKQPIPAVVLVHEDLHDLVVKRQTYEDLLRYDLIPERLEEK